jgi:hypothetical protein
VFQVTRGRIVAIVAAIVIAAVVTVDLRMPSRIAVQSDTLIVNGLHPVLLGAQLLNGHGRAIWHPGLRYSAVTPAVARTKSDGSLQCTGAGDGMLTISHGALQRQVFVRCRPIAQFGFFGGVSLEVGGPPKEFLVGAIGYDRRPVTLLRGRASLRDFSVARLHGDSVYPVAIGHALIDLEFSGGTGTRLYVSVTRTAIDTTLNLAAGEIHTWHLPTGYYSLELHTPDGQASPLVLGAIQANCALGRNGPQHYWCIMGDSSVLVVQNPNAAGSHAARSGRLLVVQFPHDGITAAREQMARK